MRGYRNSSKAEADIEQIALYIHELNPGAAFNFLNKLEETCARLAEHPQIGRRRPELGGNYRSIPVGNYLVFYVPGSDGVEIVRVIYGGRDLPQVFF